MPYTVEQLRVLIAQETDRPVELMHQVRDIAALTRLICAFANADGGTILVGIGDTKEILGTDVERIRRLYQSALSRTVNAPRTDLESIDVDGKRVAAITVNKAQDLVMTDEGVFKHASYDVQPMAPSDISRVLKSSSSTAAVAPDHLAEAISRLTRRIEDLHEQVWQGDEKLRLARSFRSQAKSYVISAMVGLTIGVLFTLLLT
ncbi:MAG TPA: ATP-binding protein [Blastocatellia bacterium]|jgi:ATP-dependent DNA helicase RecG|nr:ATP-binding protein [Blastocatellia bacterium]